jgi:Uma2 family endonuclease
MSIQQVGKPGLYQEYPELLEEADMPESGRQHDLGKHTEVLLEWHFQEQNWYLSGNIYILQHNFRPVSPDVFLAKISLTQEEKDDIESWDMREPRRPAPAWVLEIASESTWPEDLDAKVGRYNQMGVEEYFAYDPNTPMVWADRSTRLRGWRYANGTTQTIVPDARGWLWSNSLQLWVVPGGKYPTFLKADEQPLITPQQEARLHKAALERAEEQQRRAAEQAAREAERAERAEQFIIEETRRATREAERAKQAEQRLIEEAERAKQAEQKAKDEAARAALAEQKAKGEAERAIQAEERAQQLEILMRKLAERGIDPNSL